MNPKKKSRRYRASVLIQALDLAISRFIHSLGCDIVNQRERRVEVAGATAWIFLPTLAGEGIWQGQYLLCGEGSCYSPLLYLAVAWRSSAGGLGNTGGVYPLFYCRMNGEAEAWLEGAYPQLYGQWRQAYLKPAARLQDKAGDLCRICYIRQVTQLAVGTIT